jgi:hypothetical protein
MKLLYTLVTAFVLPGVMGLTSPCGAPEDSCMDNDNWNQCRNLESNGCKSIQVLKSCPLQFSCGDGDDEKNQHGNTDAVALNPPLNEDISGERSPDACVSLFVYENKKCNGPPVRVLSFPTWTAPGSPCVHDARIPLRSAEDQYCNLSTGNWHETIIVGSSKCHPPHWWWGGKVNHLTFTTDSCIGGVSLKGCADVPCDSREMDLEAFDVLNSALSLATTQL